MKPLEFLRRANSENGEPSNMRLNAFIVVVLFSFSMTFGFIWTIIFHPDIIIAYAGLLLAAILGVLGIKGWQKGKEEPLKPANEENKVPEIKTE